MFFTVNQIDVRAEQAAFLPTQLFVLSPTPSTDQGTPAARARYINFYTTLWLIANDVIVGRALGLVLCEQSGPLGGACASVIQVSPTRSTDSSRSKQALTQVYS